MGKVSPSNSHVMWMCVYVYSKITWHLSIFIKYQWYWLPVSQRFQAMVRHCLQEQRVFLDASDCPWCLCIKKQIQQHVTCLAMLPGNLTCGPSTGQSQQRQVSACQEHRGWRQIWTAGISHSCMCTFIQCGLSIYNQCGLFVYNWFSRLVVQLCPTLCDPRPVAHQAPMSTDFPGKDTGAGSHFLLQGIFPAHGSNPVLLHCRQILYHLSYQGNPSDFTRWPFCL